MNLPEEFMSRMKGLLSNEYDAFAESLSKKRERAIRVNTLKVSKEVFKEVTPFRLTGEVLWESRGYYILEDKPGRHPFHAAGLYYVQEPSAMAVVPCLNIKPGDIVLDLCAAPGGKSTQAAAYMEGQGILISNEIETKRARILSENIERLGIRNCIVTNNTPQELSRMFNGYFDKIIVDAPCSGEGMFKKEEAAVTDWSIENVKGCAVRQNDILESAAVMLKPGGYIVYSTCTFSVNENEEVIDSFLKKHREFEIVKLDKKDGYKSGLGDAVGNSLLNGTLRLFPHKIKGEGHFIALLRKHDGTFEFPERLVTNVKSEDIKYYESFVHENLCKEFSGVYFRSKDRLYLLPEHSPVMQSLRVIRGGLCLGEIKKNRFEPDHALALALDKKGCRRFAELSLDTGEAASYLRGEVIRKEGIDDGWCLVGAKGFPFGWGKTTSGTIKNHYPKGLRRYE